MMRVSTIVQVAAAGALFCAAAPAQAQWTRHQGIECRPVSVTDQSSHGNTGRGATNLSPTARIRLACRADDSSAFPDHAVTEVQIYVHDGSPTERITVRACVSRRERESGECSAAFATTNAFMGGAVITLSGAALDLWKASTDFSYLQVDLPPKFGGNSFSYLKGWVSEQ
jgi:hypothetical protein